MRRAEMRYPKLRLREGSRVRRSKRALRLGFAGGVLSHLLARRLPRVTTDDLRRHDYPTSTQRMGVRFTERIRDTFRFRWLKRTS